MALHTTRSRVSPRAGAGAHLGWSSGPSESPAHYALVWYVVRMAGLDRPLRLCVPLWTPSATSLAMARQPRPLLLLPALQALCTSDTAAACYCGCLEQLEPETIELLSTMTDVVQL